MNAWDGPVVAEQFGASVARLLRERGWSIERLAHEAWHPHIRGTSPAMIRKALRDERALTLVLMEAVASALDVTPDSFIEYRLARVRRLIDERQVGLSTAMENYRHLAAMFPGLHMAEERLSELVPNPASHRA